MQSRIIQVVHEGRTLNDKLIDTLFDLWSQEEYAKVKEVVGKAPVDLNRALRDGIAAKLEGVKREAFLNYMLV